MKDKILLLFILVWLVVPTGTPDDIITLALIAVLGLQLYVFLVLVLIGVLIHQGLTYAKAVKLSKQAKREVKKRLGL